MRYESVNEKRDRIGTFLKSDPKIEWGSFTTQKVVKYRLTQNSEYYSGHLGNYDPKEGFK